MTTRARKTASSPNELVLDKKGYLHIEKDGVQSRIVPESWRVWENEGWTLVKESEVDTPVVDDEKGN